MQNLLDAPVVVCRPALAKDTEAAMELSSHIWDGGDYIPRVWEEWLADPIGMLGVAELNGRVAGLFKLTKFQEGEWYLEGLRVHPDFQGQGVAAHIHGYCVEMWHRMGSGVLRLVTGSYNVKVHHMCEQSGFRRIAEFIPYEATGLPEETQNFTEVNLEQAGRAFEFVAGSETHALVRGCANLGWVFASLQLKHIQEAIGDRHAWWWRGGSGFISIWLDDDHDDLQPGIQILASKLTYLPDLLADYRRLVVKLGYKTAGWTAPNHPDVIPVLEQSGFVRSWDISLYFYELRSSVA